jgi:hypothetical protein
MSNASNIRGEGSAIHLPRARGILIGYLVEIGESGGSLPAGRSSCGVSLKQIARCAGISVRSAQRMRPLIGRWAITLGTSPAASFGDHR